MHWYSIVWKYKIKLKNKEKFEFEYGPDGAWNNLFRKSEDYKGSFLYQSEDILDTYLLIDTWINRESYENFKKMHAQTYEELSSKFEFLYTEEEKIGEFNSIE